MVVEDVLCQIWERDEVSSRREERADGCEMVGAVVGRALEIETDEEKEGLGVTCSQGTEESTFRLCLYSTVFMKCLC